MTKKILFEDALILSAVKALSFFGHILPLGIFLSLGRFCAGIIFCFHPRKKVAIHNLRAAFPEYTDKQRLVVARRSFSNLVVAMMELLCVDRLDASHLQRNFVFENEDKLRPYLGKGLIFLTAHFGNWEMLNIAGAMRGYQMVALARTQKHPRSDDYLNAKRSSKGTTIIRKGMMLRQMIRALESGSILGMLSDQDAGLSGVYTTFFGRSCSFPDGAVQFAIRTQTPIFPVFIYSDQKGHHRIIIHDPIVEQAYPQKDRLQRMIDATSQHMEKAIRRDPGQWLWAHKRWKSTRTKRVLILSDAKAGHESQSIGLCKAITQLDEFKSKALTLETDLRLLSVKSKFRAHVVRALVQALGMHTPFKKTLLRWSLKKDFYQSLEHTHCDVVVSAGSMPSVYNILIADWLCAKSLHIMTPAPAMRHGFDAILVPAHDRIQSASNVYETLFPLGRVVKTGAPKNEPVTLEPRSSVGVFVGGDSASYMYEKSRFMEIMQQISRTALTQNIDLYISSSRRTPAWAEQYMKQVFSPLKQCRMLVLVGEQNPPETVSTILDRCDLFLVSEESVSMVSDCIQAGKITHVFSSGDKRRLKRKHQNFLSSLERRGLICRVGSAGLNELNFQVNPKVEELASCRALDSQAIGSAAKRVGLA